MDSAVSGRAAQQQMEQILGWVQADANLRVALLNGSRANPALAPDLLSDWDLLLGVRDLAPFAGDAGWLARFGRVRLLQRPGDGPGHVAWLVVFGDGARVDFTFVPLAAVAPAAASDSLTRVLVDKDGLLPPLPPADESSHWAARPSAEAFAASINEFWWVAPYVAKGLWRGQLPYARHCFEAIVRPELERLLVWHASAQRGWRFNPGGYNKHLQSALEPSLWDAYLATLPGATITAHWAALDVACALMDHAGPQVAAILGYAWDEAEAQGARELIAALRAAPRTATTLGLA